MSTPLPTRPSLKQLKSQAKDLLRAHQDAEEGAIARISASLPRLLGAVDEEVRAARLTLRDMQLVIAREYGFPSWPKLQRYLKSDACLQAADGVALGHGVMHGDTQAVDVLVSNGVVPDSFWQAAGSGRLDLVQTYFSADGHLKPEAGASRPPRAFIGPPPESPRSEDPGDVMAEAFIYACWHGRVDVVEYLLSRGVDVNARPLTQYSALHGAADKGHDRVVDLLLDNGADVVGPWDRHTVPTWTLAAHSGHDSIRDRLQDIAEHTHIFVAAVHGRADRVQEILREGVDPSTIQTALDEAAAHGHKEVCDALVEAGGRLDICGAAALDRLESVRATLAEMPAQLEATDAYGKTPLLAALSTNASRTAQYLLEEGAAAGKANIWGHNSLHIAASVGANRRIIGLLLERGVDVNALSPRQQTALDMAQADGHTETATVLREHGAQLGKECSPESA